MIFAAVERLLASVPVSNGDIAALRSRDSVLTAGALAHIWQHSGMHLLQLFFIVAGAASLLWMVAAAVGRIVTLEPLVERGRRNYAGVFGISFLRVLWAWLAIVAGIAVLLAASYAAVEVSRDPARPNFALYLLLVLIGLPIVLVVWGVLNWYLSLAPIFCMRDGQRAFDSIGKTMRAAREKRGQFWKISAGYTAPRIIAVVLLIALAAVIAAGLKTGSAIAVVIALSLIYFAVADFLYVARMAAYVELLGDNFAPNSIKVSAPSPEPLPQSL
jgi:hypothetical protein